MENQMLDQSEIATVIIAQMANIPSEREKLIAALGKNGVVMDINTPNEELYTAIFSGIVYSKAFRTDIKKAVYSFLQENVGEQAMDAGFYNSVGGFGSAGLFAGQMYQQAQTKTKTTTSKAPKKPFAETWAGKTLGSIFSPENVGAAVNTGINALNQKLTTRADKQTIQEAVEFETKKAENYDKQQELEDTRKKWVVPVIIASSIVVLAIIGYLIYKNRKK